MDSKLPFGLQSAPKIFIAHSRYFRMVHGKRRGAGSVDDFIVLGPSSSEVCG